MNRGGMGKRRPGGWAATLKTALRQGKPICQRDPRYLNVLQYVYDLAAVLARDAAYHDAVRARCRQRDC